MFILKLVNFVDFKEALNFLSIIFSNDINVNGGKWIDLHLTPSFLNVIW